MIIANHVLYSQSEFITPELQVQFDDNAYNHNFHIVSDGTFYYTSNGGSASKGMINKYDLSGKFIQSYTIALDMRGLMYNSNDKCLYTSTYDKGVYKITDLAKGTYSNIFSKLFEYDQASLALSPDNKYIYYFYKGTLKKYDFANGSLIKTFYNLKCGSTNYGGDGAVAVDDTHIYTCDATNKKIFVYDMSGNYVKEFYISYGSCGMALSYTNNLLFISVDGNYKTGKWYGYKIKKTTTTTTTTTTEVVKTTTSTVDASDLQTPILKMQFQDNAYNHNFHITFDGNYYYASNGGSVSKGFINKYDLTGKFIQQYPILLDMRGVMYNNTDKCFYISAFDKNIYKVNNLSTGSFSKLYSSLYDYDQASIELSSDNNYFYYMKQGTLKKFKVSDGTLVKTIYNLKCGKNLLAGDGNVAVDDKYIYTYDGDNKKLYIYDLEGNYVKEYTLANGTCGAALSCINDMIFISDDGNYKTGNWYAYKVRNKTVVTEVVTNSDVDGPLITITSPDLSRGLKPLDEKTIKIAGTATDVSGIYEVKINGEEAAIDAKGNFSKNVLLAVGENVYTVTATDSKSNTTKKTFTLTRNEITEEVTPINEPVTTNKTIKTTGKYYALIIGVEDYQDAAINDLDNPIKDAQSLYTALITYYTFETANIKFLKNPTVLDITNALDYYYENCTDKDNLLIFYAGHGYWDENFKQGYWLAADSYKTTRGTWLSNSTIRDYMKAIPVKHNLLITDACFGGGIFKSRDAFANADIATNQLYELPSRKAMTSGALSEVPDKSVFIEYLVKRLTENKDTYLSSEQLFAKFKIAVINNSSNGQVPQYGEVKETGDEGGDFIFIKK